MTINLVFISFSWGTLIFGVDFGEMTVYYVSIGRTQGTLVAGVGFGGNDHILSIYRLHPGYPGIWC